MKQRLQITPPNLFYLSLLVPLLFAPQTASAQEWVGEPWVRHTIDNSSQGADGIRLMDVNLDGLQDIATGWEEGGEIHVCLNPGRDDVKSPWPMINVGKVSSPEDAVFCDFNNDRRVDVVSCCEGDTRTIYMHLAPPLRTGYENSKLWTTEPLVASVRKQRWMYCLPMHVDHENGVDLVAGGKGPNASVGWFEAPRRTLRKGDWVWHPISPVGWLMSLHSLDMDVDGDLDIVLSDRRGVTGNQELGPNENRAEDRTDARAVRLRGVRWLENPGNRRDQVEQWKSHPIGGERDEVMFMQPTDFDSNGVWDFFVATRAQEILFLRGKPGSPVTYDTIRIPIPPTAGTAKAVQLADINLDRQLDLVVSCENAENKMGLFWMSINLNREGTVGQLTPYNVSGMEEGIKYDLVEAIDLDQDGDFDLLTCEERDNLGVIWYENPLK
ncbi:FG-GAP repeat protein [Polystyrenella longa]|uniref:FG-GAP repeat protein n=1 Tax=Polystyrenella longa TaxID=2528007 RepID=A0A518CIM5_9PLAN|nr:VCBS repeat-containing protein [Polystyrenella longa]QDU79083.1 FG-GAP repeat protein [Polystyrenella longa]